MANNGEKFSFCWTFSGIIRRQLAAISGPGTLKQHRPMRKTTNDLRKKTVLTCFSNTFYFFTCTDLVQIFFLYLRTVFKYLYNVTTYNSEDMTHLCKNQTLLLLCTYQIYVYLLIQGSFYVYLFDLDPSLNNIFILIFISTQKSKHQREHRSENEEERALVV